MALDPAPPNAVQPAEPPAPSADAEELFHVYSPQLYRYCLGRLGSPEEAEDAVQVTYLNAWRSLRRGTHPADPRPWLFTIAANVCSTALRTKLRGARIEVHAPEDFEGLPAKDTDGEELVGLDDALKALPLRQREALLLRDWRGLSYEEIATTLHASQPAVETLLFRARRALAASLERPVERVRRSPLRSALPALVPWPSAFSSLKSSLTGLGSSLPGGAVTAKAVGVAVGAITPIVAYGVVELTVRKEERVAPPRVSPAASAELRFDAPRERAWSLLVEESAPGTRAEKKPAAGKGAVGKQATPGRSRSASGPGSDGGAVAGAKGAPAAGSEPAPASGGEPGPAGPGKGAEPPPTPAEPDEHAPAPAPGVPSPSPAAGGKVLLCHLTGSKKNPGVTIEVSEAAVAAHLEHGDQLGACPG